MDVEDSKSKLMISRRKMQEGEGSLHSSKRLQVHLTEELKQGLCSRWFHVLGIFHQRINQQVLCIIFFSMCINLCVCVCVCFVSVRKNSIHFQKKKKNSANSLYYNFLFRHYFHSLFFSVYFSNCYYCERTLQLHLFK